MASTARDRTPRDLKVTLGRTPPEESVSLLDASWLDQEARKEELTINEVEAADGGGGLKRLFSLTLETLPADDGYWLDTGILTVG
jgi:hypothetical protein